MSGAPPTKKFVHKGQLVDSIPFHIRTKRVFQELYTIVLLYLWTLFSIDAKQAALSFSKRGYSSAGEPEKKRLGRINNPN